MSVEFVAALIEAINERDAGRLSELVDERSEVVTGRATHTGPDAITAWAQKEYDHLVRRYAIDEYRGEGETVLALGSVQYVWAEEGDVADSSPIALVIEIGDGRLSRLTIHDDPVAALAGFTN